MSKILAQKGSQRRQFSLSVWQTLPADKYGWKQVADEPDAVRHLRLSKGTTEQQYSNMIKEARQSGDKEKLKEILNAKVDQ